MTFCTVQTGWFNSFAGVVKRRFATYMKLHLAPNGDSKDKSKKDKDKEKVKSLATVSPIHKNFKSNPFAQSPSPLPSQLANSQPTSGSPLTGIDRRHRSPDPPPRLNRGQQSPLLLRHKLELAQSGSPLMQKR
jgi:mitogen-activated protein kinase kinase 7